MRFTGSMVRIIENSRDPLPVVSPARHARRAFIGIAFLAFCVLVGLAIAASA